MAKDATGAPLLGVSVIVNGTTVGTSTSINGEYEITCDPNAELTFSFIGYETQVVPVANRTMLNVTLQEDSQMVDDVIVIGYGTTTRKRATGAVDQVKASALADRSVSSLAQVLQGTSPSLVIQQRSSNPNDQELNINIRGIGTMNNNSPLFVIDGMVCNDSEQFQKLNPNDIESVSVLKDAGTAAIYGSRAANGVLLVTTKKGRKNQAPQVSLNAMVGWNVPDILATQVSGWKNATLRNLAAANSGKDPLFTVEQIQDLKAHQSEDQYWMDYIFKTSFQQNYNVSVQGGSENTTYMISAGYFDQESNFVGPSYGVTRYNFRTNIVTEYKRFKVTAQLAYTRSDEKTTIDGNAIANAQRLPTYYYYKPQDPVTGHYLINDLLTDQSPLGFLKEGGYNKHDNDYVNGQATLDFKILEGLTLRGALGMDLNAKHRYTKTNTVNLYMYNDPDGAARPANTDDKSEDWNEKAWLINSQIMLDFDRTFGKHHVAAMFGASNESFTRKSNQIGLQYADPDLGIKGDGTVIKPDSFVSPENTTRTSLTSMFGRLSYDYASKYFIDATFRYDGSSKFADDLRWGFFPSVSLGWRLSEEGWMENYRDKAGDLKLRLSYGTLGNQAVSDYQYFTTYEVYSNTYGFNNTPVGGAGFKLGTDNLQWEVSHTLNVGLDASFFRNTLNVSFDFFHKRTTDILVKPQTPLMLGTELQHYNAGEMKTQGWELNLTYNLNRKDWRHSFSFNIGDSWNEVVKFEGFENLYTAGEFWRITREGLPYNSYYGYKTDGFFQSYDEIRNSALPTGRDATSLQPGDVKFKDRNGDGVIDEDDRYYLGNAFPRYTFGFTYNVAWKGIDLSIFLQGVLKRDMMVRGELIEPFQGNYGYTMYDHQLDFWTPTNTNAKYPRLADPSDSHAITNNWGMGSDLLHVDGSYLRVKNLALGYTLPERWTKKAGISKFRIYVNAQNLLTFSNMSYLDPEASELDGNMSGWAITGRRYPNIRYVGMGIDLTF
ncbi:TonB-dependent receptor [uncultured Alistipes sp.]|uniref:SusC/RagA family TonB-linked outer membrane protein n=1 Tax=uncultured Alistipes sp. TaxID=538949 RepID=UPI0025E73A52|nr:TonB-dependent receptor [uncultured Alistipes sp.]